MKRFVRISPFCLPVILIAVLGGFWQRYLLMLTVMVFHELAHLLALWKREVLVQFIALEPFGMHIRLQKALPEAPEDEIIMALAGPLCNFLLALFLRIGLSFASHPEVQFFYVANLCCGTLNLLPAVPLDGGRVLRAFLSKWLGYIKAFYFCQRLTKVLSFLLILAGGYLLWKTGFNFSLCLIGCFLYSNLLTEKQQFHLYLMREIADYKKGRKLKETIPVCHLAADGELRAGKLLSRLCHNRYYMVTVLSDIHPIGMLTEGELINGMIKKGVAAKLKEFVC